jgi:hypothetical protein
MAAIDWSAVTALATVALVIAASAAALYAKRDIDAHLSTSADDLRATARRRGLPKRPRSASSRRPTARCSSRSRPMARSARTTGC